MKNKKIQMECPTIQGLKDALGENNFRLRAANYFISENRDIMREAIRSMQESVRKMEEATRWLVKESDSHREAA